MGVLPYYNSEIMTVQIGVGNLQIGAQGQEPLVYNGRLVVTRAS